MIYSQDIPKICSLCVFSSAAADGEEIIYCQKRKREVKIMDEACKKYRYDITKRQVRRKKPLKTDFDAKDFEL